MVKTQYINLNMVPSGVLPMLHVSQYDIGRPLGLVVYDGTEKFNLTGYTVSVEATRSDGTAIFSGVTTSKNVGVFVTTATMTNRHDIYDAQMVIIDSSENRVASLPFVMHVVKAAMNENGEPVEEDKSLFQQYTAVVQAALAEINGKLDDPGYYEGITVTTGTYINENNAETTYYLVSIPPTDTDGDNIPIVANYDPDTTPLIHAQKELTTLTTNTSLELRTSLPGVISGGEVIRASAWNESAQYPYVVYVGFDEDRVPHEYPVDTPLATMISEGITEATVAYYRLVIDGAARDVSNIGLSAAQLRVNPRNAMFVKSDNTLCFLLCDGRDGSNEGLTPSELADLMVENGAVQGWNLDGGGSSSMVLKGSKLNRNIDGGGTLDRTVSVTWNVPHKFVNTAIQKAFANTGVEKQRIIQQLMPEIQTNGIKTVANVSMASLTDGIYYIVNASDSPTAIDDGFCVVFEKYTGTAGLKKLIWYPYAADCMWMNSYTGTDWTGWKAIDVLYGYYRSGEKIPSTADLDNYTIPAKYYVANIDDASAISNCPSGYGGTLEVTYLTTSNALMQKYIDINRYEYRRRGTVSGSAVTWTYWRCVNPMQSLSFTVAANSSKTITFTGSVSCLVNASPVGVSAYCNYLYNGYGSSANQQHMNDLGSGSLVTYTLNANNSFTISNAASSAITLNIVFIGVYTGAVTAS